MDPLQDISFDEQDAVQQAFVEYSIFQNEIAPDEVNTILGLVPSRSWAQGELYRGRARDPETAETIWVERKRHSGLWTLSSLSFTASLRVQEHVVCLLDRLEPKREAVQTLLTRKDCLVRFYIRWEPKDGHGSFQIENTVLSRMARLCHEVEYAFVS